MTVFTFFSEKETEAKDPWCRGRFAQGTQKVTKKKNLRFLP